MPIASAACASKTGGHPQARSKAYWMAWLRTGDTVWRNEREGSRRVSRAPGEDSDSARPAPCASAHSASARNVRQNRQNAPGSHLACGVPELARVRRHISCSCRHRPTRDRKEHTPQRGYGRWRRRNSFRGGRSIARSRSSSWPDALGRCPRKGLRLQWSCLTCAITGWLALRLSINVTTAESASVAPTTYKPAA